MRIGPYIRTEGSSRGSQCNLRWCTEVVIRVFGEGWNSRRRKHGVALLLVLAFSMVAFGQGNPMQRGLDLFRQGEYEAALQ
jgi:hypothetical protein